MMQKLNIIEEDFKMKATYLIKLIEDYCKEKSLDISDTYNKLAELYQNEDGTNIIIQM